MRIGALITLARIASAPRLAALHALPVAAAEIGNPHVRLRGTLGGNLGYRAPSPSLPPALIALVAMVVLARSFAITAEQHSRRFAQSPRIVGGFLFSRPRAPRP